MDEFAEMAAREREATRIAKRQWFWLHLAVYVPIQVMLFIIWNSVEAQFPWHAFPLLGWEIILAVHGVYAFVMKTPEEIMIERERREVATSTGRA
jgi:predicted membrane channel-forming protein YqfA (hemolysin III family)